MNSSIIQKKRVYLGKSSSKKDFLFWTLTVFFVIITLFSFINYVNKNTIANNFNSSFSCINQVESNCTYYENLNVVETQNNSFLNLGNTYLVVKNNNNLFSINLPGNVPVSTNTTILAQLWENNIVLVNSQNVFSQTTLNPNYISKEAFYTFIGVLLISVLIEIWIFFLTKRYEMHNDFFINMAIRKDDMLFYYRYPTIKSIFMLFLTLEIPVIMVLIFFDIITKETVFFSFLACLLFTLVNVLKGERERIILDYDGIDYTDGKIHLLIPWKDMIELKQNTKKELILVVQDEKQNTQNINLTKFTRFNLKNSDLIWQLQFRLTNF